MKSYPVMWGLSIINHEIRIPIKQLRFLSVPQETRCYLKGFFLPVSSPNNYLKNKAGYFLGGIGGVALINCF